MHEAVAARAFGAVGPAESRQLAHDAIAKGVYGTIRAGGKIVGQIASAVADVPRNENGDPACSATTASAPRRWPRSTG